MRLTPDLSIIGSGALGMGIGDPLDGAVYVVDGGTELALIDAGTGRDVAASIERLIDDGRQAELIRWVLLTHEHPDHAGGAHAWREALGVTVVASPATAAIVRAGDLRASGLVAAREAGIYPPDLEPPATPVGRELRDGEQLSIGTLRLTALATPGHTAGHLCYLVEGGARRMLFTGDHLFWGGRIASHDTGSRAAYRHGLERLRGVRFDALLPGHLQLSLSGGMSHVERALEATSADGMPPDILDVLGLPRVSS